MLLKNPVLYLFFIIFMTVIVDSQICIKHGVVSTTVQESYSETYHGQCGYRMCIKRQVKTRLVPRREVQSFRYCCNGYIRVDDRSDDSDIVCNPICMPACKNGYCKSPGQCACNTGYKVDTGDSHNCLPLCEKGCNHGTCVGPDICECDFGYTLANGTCQPICTEPCNNGICVSPETCECLHGYRKSDKNICEPYCSYGCDDNGYCAAPESCVCNSGWHMTTVGHLANKVCKPHCSNPCLNGICIAPNICECLSGYKKSENDTCEPECEPGWILEANKCVPHCKFSCGNGTCLLPNLCNCSPGYHIDMPRLLKVLSNADEPLCVPTCTECIGDCVAPNKCLREEVSTTIQEDLCDNFQNCSTEKSSETTSFSVPAKSTTDSYYDDYENENDLYDDFDAVPNYGSNGTISDVFENTFSGEPKKDANKSSWILQHWASVLIPIIAIIAAGVLLLLAFRRKVFFKGSYVIEDAPLDNNGSYPFEDIKISSTNENDTKEAQNI